MARIWRYISFLPIALTVAQQSPGTIAVWQDARAGVVGDTLYIEGGIFGTWSAQPGLYNPDAGTLASLNFSVSFNQQSNFTALFNFSYVSTSPSFRAHVNGFMFADTDEWYSFGGRAFQSVDNTTSHTGIIRDGIHQPNSLATKAATGITVDFRAAGNSTNNYITNGAGVSAPSESLGFYFSGLSAVQDQDMSWNAKYNATDSPSLLVNTILIADTSEYNSPNWAERPLPDTVFPRADAALAWIPVGERGALVAIGGVSYPAALIQGLMCNLNSVSQASNNSKAPTFMDTIPIYDVDTNTWYVQQTSGESPPQLAQACAVVASSQDNTVHNIYIYGGYSGVDATNTNDEVWILSVPSFVWVKAAEGTQTHGRYGHVCAKPYPDQMLIVGGATGCNDQLNTTAVLDVFDLNELAWKGSYDPLDWHNYTTPTKVAAAISATPTASGMDQGLVSLLGTRYTKTIPSSYPYNPAITPITPSPPSKPGTSHPKWLIPVVVVTAVVVVIIIVGTAVWFCLRHRHERTSEMGRSRRSIFDWLGGHTHGKSVRSEDETTQVGAPIAHEAFGKPILQTTAAELAGDSDGQTPVFASPMSSPRGPASPPSDPSGAELHSQSLRHELPGETRSYFPTQNIKNHPMYPPSLGGHFSPGRTLSSPSADPMSPYELLQNEDQEAALPQPPDDLVLGQSKFGISQESAASPKSPFINGTHVGGDVSPALSAADISPEQNPVAMPVTPPQQPISSVVPKTSHTRNASSLSSSFPDLSSPSPREDQRRSVAIAALPSPPIHRRDTNQTNANNHNTAKIHESRNEPASPALSRLPDTQIRRKEVSSSHSQHGVFEDGSNDYQSAYQENEGRYGSSQGSS